MEDGAPTEEAAQERRPRRRTRRLALWAGAGALACVLAVAAPWVYRTFTYRLSAVAEGRLYRAAEMPSEKLAATCVRLGVRTVIDFRRQKDKAAAERKALGKVGVGYVHLPSNQVPEQDVVNAFLKIMDDPKRLPALIHCTHGVGRTGVFSAIYLIEYEGWDNERARRESQRLGGMSSFGKGKPKGRFVLEYAPRKKGNKREQ